MSATPSTPAGSSPSRSNWRANPDLNFDPERFDVTLDGTNAALVRSIAAGANTSHNAVINATVTAGFAALGTNPAAFTGSALTKYVVGNAPELRASDTYRAAVAALAGEES